MAAPTAGSSDCDTNVELAPDREFSFTQAETVKLPAVFTPVAVVAAYEVLPLRFRTEPRSVSEVQVAPPVSVAGALPVGSAAAVPVPSARFQRWVAVSVTVPSDAGSAKAAVVPDGVAPGYSVSWPAVSVA